MYLLYGLNDYLIKKYIKQILEENSLTDIDVTNYNLDTDKINDIIHDAETISLFTPKKAIIVDNAVVFKNNTIDQTELEKYLNNPNLDTILIFIVHDEKVDERKKITKLFRSKYKVIELNDQTIYPIVSKMFDGFKIDKKTIEFFIDRVGNNLMLLEQEANKIMIYKESGEITIDDIKLLTSKTVEVDLFKLIDAIITKDKNTAMTIYNEMLKMKEEPIAIIITLANQIRIMYQTKELYNLGYLESDMASLLNIHPFRVKKAREKARSYSSEVLLSYLEKLADLDLNIKKGIIDKDMALEMFILQI